MEKQRRKKLIKRIAQGGMIIAALAITILSLLPDLPQPGIDIPYLDKIEHFIAYAMLSGLTLISFWKRQYRIRYAVIIVFFLTLFGGILEILQFFTGRSTELADLIADFLGAAAGGIMGKIVTVGIFREPQKV